jgi:hypothetical protein
VPSLCKHFTAQSNRENIGYMIFNLSKLRSLIVSKNVCAPRPDHGVVSGLVSTTCRPKGHSLTLPRPSS